LTDSFSQVGCLLASGKNSELLCAGAMLTFDCTSATQRSGSGLGPNCAQLSACCNSNTFIQSDQACLSDWQTADENLCNDDLYYYQTDPFGDCL
jgi:hypothetical protein